MITEGLSLVDKEINETLSQEKDLNSLKLPYVVKNHILMSPGVWNNFKYTKLAITNALSNTEWSQKARSLFWEHDDQSAKEWVGEVKNLSVQDGNLIGDVVIVDMPLAIKLAYGAKFGVSPKIAGMANADKVVGNATFENFSIVLNPAVKTTFLNSEIKLEEKHMEAEFKELNELKQIVSTLAEQVKKLAESAEAEKKIAAEELKKKEDAIAAAKIAEEKKLQDEAIAAEKKKYPYPEEMSEILKGIKSELEELKKSKLPVPAVAKCEEKLGPAGDIEAKLVESKAPAVDVQDSTQKIANELRELDSGNVSAKFTNAPTDADVGMANYLRRLLA